jgi:hypothetical protein
MPRYSNFPTLIDELRSFTIADLKKLSYFKKGAFVSGTMNWINRDNEITSSICIAVHNSEFNSYLELDYKCNGGKFNYKVDIVMLPSNLGKGKVKYFICPFTKKRCSKLHLIDGRFMHRSALSNPLYSKQVESKRWREWSKMFGAPFKLENVYEELYSKGFTKYYNGKPTKRYQKLLKCIRRYEGNC